jgi:hypothetical protein
LLDAINSVEASASAKAGGGYSIGSKEEIGALTLLANGPHHDWKVRVVVEDDYAITVAFPGETVDASLFRKDGANWAIIKRHILPDSCALVLLGVPRLTADKLESAVFANALAPPHHAPCASHGD